MSEQRRALVLFRMEQIGEGATGASKKISIGETVKFSAKKSAQEEGKRFSGWLCRDGEIESEVLESMNDGQWLVGEVDLADISPVHTQCTFRKTTVRFSGSAVGAESYLRDRSLLAAKIAIKAAHLDVADQEMPTIANFDERTASTGDGGIAITGSGSAKAGTNGIALASNGGAVCVGDGGVAITTEVGVGMVGEGGVLIMGRWLDEETGGPRFTIGYAGEDINPHTPYVLDEDYKFVEFED